MNEKLNIFVSSVQKELEDERVIVQNLLNTDPFLSAHCSPILYEFEPASPDKALEGCLKSLDGCHVYLLIVAAQYGTLVGKLSITHAEYRRAKEKKLPVLAFIKGDRKVKREDATEALLKGTRRRRPEIQALRQCHRTAKGSPCRPRQAPKRTVWHRAFQRRKRSCAANHRGYIHIRVAAADEIALV
jgi:hypothetical protein